MSNKIENRFDAEIKIKSYKKKVKITDDYYIEFDPRDSFFISKVLSLVQDVQKIGERTAKEFEENYKEDIDIKSDLGELYNGANTAQIEIAEKLNNAFGKDFCVRALGREIPILEDVIELLGQLQEIMQKLSEDVMKEKSSIFLEKQKARERS